MRILILGGTQFVGRAIVSQALQESHDVALFNRGSNRDLFPSVPRHFGDRNDREAIEKVPGVWDCIIDVSAYHPRAVRATLQALEDRTAHYVFISTVSVYADPVPPDPDESAPLIDIAENVSNSETRAYGGLKVLCERELQRVLGERLTVLRPTVVMGPHDPTDRFTWWVRAASEDRRIPVPRLRQPVQLIDARDLAAFAVRTAERSTAGVFNVAGPPAAMTLEALVRACALALNTNATPEERPVEVPLALPVSGEDDGVFQVSIARAVAAGLRHRPFVDSVRDTRAWDLERGEPPLRTGPSL